jgi:hypothetical protein
MPSLVRIAISYALIGEPLSSGSDQAIRILPPSLAVTGAKVPRFGLVAALI